MKHLRNLVAVEAFDEHGVSALSRVVKVKP